MTPPLASPDSVGIPPAPTRLGEAMRRLRLAAGLTLEQAAERMREAGESCGKSYLSEVENARRPAPSDDFLVAAERCLGAAPGSLVQLAGWERTPYPVRQRFEELRRRAESSEQDRARLRSLLRSRSLDEAWRSGSLERLVSDLDGRAVGDDGTDAQGRTSHASPQAAARALPLEVPLINSVAAGYPREFTDLGYPVRVADEYVRVPDVSDPDAFAARVVGDSMSPVYLEGDIVVFSPARIVKSGSDCFARLEPDHETTFKRVYFDTLADGQDAIRLQPINPAYPPRTLPREMVAGLYAAVSVVRTLA